MASQNDNIAKEDFYMAKKEEIIEVTNDTEIEVTSVTVSSLIHIIRGKQAILDSDLSIIIYASSRDFSG